MDGSLVVIIKNYENLLLHSAIQGNKIFFIENGNNISLNLEIVFVSFIKSNRRNTIYLL